MPDTPTPNNMPGANAGEPPKAPASATPAAQAPPWGADQGNYDPDKAATLISNLRDSEKAKKTEIEALKAQLADAKPLLDAAEQQRQREQGETATLREQVGTLQAQLDAAQTAAKANLGSALQAKAEALGASRPDGAFVNPTTAARLIDLTECLTDSGQINEAAIASKLDALAQSDPYLIASATPGARKPNPAQGQGNGAVSAADAQQHAEKSGDVKGALRAAAQQLIEARQSPTY